MTFVRDGYPVMAASGALAIGVLAASVWRRSWSLWLLAFILLLFAASVAWTYRTPTSGVPGTGNAVLSEPRR